MKENTPAAAAADTQFYIASLKHTHKHHEHIVWWQKDHCGYTPVLGDYAGLYGPEDAATMNTGGDYIAVPVEVVRELMEPEPYYRRDPPGRFYDQRGPVVSNTRANWNRLIAAAQPARKPKLEPFRGVVKSFTLEPTP